MKRFISSSSLSLAILILPFGCTFSKRTSAQLADSWNRGHENNPSFFQRYGELIYDFQTLKSRTEGQIDRQPWSDPYWSHAEGGITVRWRVENNDATRFQYRSPHTPEEIDAMAIGNSDAISMLSPAEKYDLVTGTYRKGWSLWQREAKATSHAPITFDRENPFLPIRIPPVGIEDKDWQGKCHAWTPAALLYEEPGAVDFPATTSNGAKFNVHFGSSDIKALLIAGFDMYLNQYPDYARVGTRCGSDEENLPQGSATACLDTNAGTFFILTTNLIQKGKPGFIIDVVPTSQVWNQPVWRYENEIRENHCDIGIETPAVPNERVAQVKTILFWISEKSASETAHGNANLVKTTEYNYCVEIDENNRVVGGEWIGDERPDFIWMVGKPSFDTIVKDTLTGDAFDLSPVLSIYNASLNSNPTPMPTETPRPTPPPTPTPSPKLSLTGQWVGLCGHTSSSMSCDQLKLGPALAVGMCDDGFEYHHISARWQGANDNSGSNERWTGTCLRKPQLNSETSETMRLHPERYALRFGFYGLCVFNYDAKECNKVAAFPMSPNKSCPSGFTFKEISSRWAGSSSDPDRFRVATCVALNDGDLAENPPSQALSSLCVYRHDSSSRGGSCEFENTGEVASRGVCGEGERFLPISARHNGRNERWVGTCLKN